MKLRENFVQAAKELIAADGAPEGARSEPQSSFSEPKRRDRLDDRVAALQSLLGGKEAATSSVTLIGEGAIIHGNVESSDPVELQGTVNGNITCGGELRLFGCLNGDASAPSILVDHGRMRGNITAQKDVRIEGDSIVIGNVSAENLSLNAKLKGDLNVRHTLMLEPCAALFGNAGAATISIQEGAVFQGEMKITSADVAALFPEESKEESKKE